MNAKLLMLIVDESKKEDLQVLLSRLGVEGYTEIPGALGVGATGPRLGSRAFPRTSAILFTVVAADALQETVTAIREYCADCGERLKMIVWGVEEVQ